VAAWNTPFLLVGPVVVDLVFEWRVLDGLSCPLNAVRSMDF
jgi:hypothetical protein